MLYCVRLRSGSTLWNSEEMLARIVRTFLVSLAQSVHVEPETQVSNIKDQIDGWKAYTENKTLDV